jgi:hypothetical protein
MTRAIVGTIVESQSPQLDQCNRPDEVAADFVTGKGMAIDEQHAPARANQMHGGRRACRPRSDDDDIGIHPRRGPQTHDKIGNWHQFRRALHERTSRKSTWRSGVARILARPASGRHCAVRYESGPLSETVCGATTPRKRAHERATSNASNEIADVDMDEEPCVLRTWNQALSELSTPPITARVSHVTCMGLLELFITR